MYALKSTITEVKQHMTEQFSSMAAADINIIMACIKDCTCSYMRSLEHQEGANSIDPDDDIPSGPEVLEQLPPEKRYTKEIKDNITSIFNHIANAQSEASLAAANIAALAKMADAETLDTVLKAAVRPLVQINWPENTSVRQQTLNQYHQRKKESKRSLQIYYQTASQFKYEMNLRTIQHGYWQRSHILS